MTTEPEGLPPTVAEVRARTLVGVVQAELERQILSGRIAPGERLNEQAIADQLSVSRGPVREACRGLAEIGLVTLIPNRGAFVKHLTRADAVDVYDLRAGLLGLSASLLAARMDLQVSNALDGFVEEMEEAAQVEDTARFGKLNTAFHDCIVRASGNARLTRLYRGLVKEFQLFRAHAIVQQGSLVTSNQEHREIVLALKAGDAGLSWRISSGHVEHGKQRMLAALETSGGATAATPTPAQRRRGEEQDQR